MAVVGLATNHCHGDGVETADVVVVVAAADVVAVVVADVADDDDDEPVEEHFGGTFDDYYFGYNLEETEQGNLGVFFVQIQLSWN